VKRHSAPSTDKPLKDTQGAPEHCALGTLNQRFHETLGEFSAKAREALASGRVPVLLRLDDRLVLSVGDDRRAFNINARDYHLFKALAHLPLLAYLLRATGQGSAANSSTLQEALLETESELDWDALELGPISEVKAALEKVLTKSCVRDDDGQSLAILKTLQARCVQLAAKGEVASLCDAAQQVRRALEPSQWQEMHVVISGGTQPRYKQLSKNFFIRLLEDAKGDPATATHQVIYSESCQELDGAIKLVTKRLVNGHLAELFMNSPVDLDEDVLGDAGLAAIESVFGREPSPE
jgi:hypothetical protein